MQESPELAAARQREQATKEHWPALYHELTDLRSRLEYVAACEQAAYQADTDTAVERSRIERQERKQLADPTC